MTTVHVGQVEIDDRGVAFVGRSRMKVRHIVAEQRTLSATPEEIADAHDTLTLADVYTALAYYADHTEEIEQQLVEETEYVEECRRRSGQPEDLREQLQQRLQARRQAES